MIVIEIEDTKGNTLGAFELTENNTNGDIEINNTINFSIADITLDDIFNSNNQKIRMQLEENNG